MRIILFLVAFVVTFTITTFILQTFKPFDKFGTSTSTCHKEHTVTKTDSGPLYGNAMARHSMVNEREDGGTSSDATPI